MEEPYQAKLGYDFVHPESRVARFMDEQHMLLDKYRNEAMHLKAEIIRLENESDYWKKECDKADAEVKRLRSASFVTAVPSEEYEKLKNENKRLRKAGDELYKWAGAENRPPQQVYAAWNAAKEGAAK